MQSPDSPRCDRVDDVGPHELGHQWEVARLGCVTNSLIHITALLEPDRCSSMQAGNRVGLVGCQVVAQDILQQVVHPQPVRLVVDRNEQLQAPLEFGQEVRGVVSLENGVAQRP